MPKLKRICEYCGIEFESYWEQRFHIRQCYVNFIRSEEGHRELCKIQGRPEVNCQRSKSLKAAWAAGKMDRIFTEERNQKISKAHTGRKRSEKQCRALSEGVKRSYVCNGGRLREERSKSNRASWERGDRDHQRGDSHYNWRGGKSFELYGLEFDERFKEIIRERDGYRCAICWLPGCDVHHIDCDKQNTQSLNCITLCRSCHIFAHQQSNYDDYWQVKLQQFVFIRENFRREREELQGVGNV